jgi:hypothetical protein
MVGLAVKATRKSRRKPLESLKTDSEIAAGGRFLARAEPRLIACGEAGEQR